MNMSIIQTMQNKIIAIKYFILKFRFYLYLQMPY